MEMKNKYLTMLAKEYPTIGSTTSEIINLEAIMNLPKATEHFVSDIHGEYDAFQHVLKNGSGNIKEKIGEIFTDRLTQKGMKHTSNSDLLSRRENRRYCEDV